MTVVGRLSEQCKFFKMEACNDRILIHLAVIEGNYDVVKFLIKREVPINARASNRDLSVQFKTDPEHQRQVGYPNSESDYHLDISAFKRCTALHLAVRHEDKAIVELLVRNGAEVDARMEGGETPLIIAVLEGQVSIVKLLLEHGANANTKTHWGKTALHYAAQLGNKYLVELLLKHEANFNVVSKEGLTPLHIATEAGYKDVVAVLIKCGANLDMRTRSGATAIHFAAVMEHETILELLVQGGADLSSICNRGVLDLSPFEWVSPDKEMKVRELVSKYTCKNSLLNWYNSMIFKFYKKPKNRRDHVNSAI